MFSNVTAMDRVALGVQLAYESLNNLMLEPLGKNASLSAKQEEKTAELVSKLDSAM